MLIVEGPDLAGKTMLCMALLKRLWENPAKFGQYPAVYEHFSRLPPSWQFPKSYLPFIKRYSIMDRFHLSELCYGRATRGGTRLTDHCVRFLDAQLALVGSYTIVITMDDEFLKKKWAEKPHPEEMFSLEQVLEVNRQYKSLRDYNPEAHVDAWYSVDCEEDYVGRDQSAVDSILRAWTSRLGYLMAVYRDHYQYANLPVNEVEVLRAKA